ncbi:MAG: NADH:ubiquinone reductase (Na(+)-transporting) subunit D [Candidatus Omnitrophica bacterium]|nr:NADH:ubiquinone reductase (Na(+)-transporting) subunit D [Candidatus Omnitrophota bacterium]
MSNEPQTQHKPRFGRTEKKLIKDALWDQNPISVQILGICSALAVTVMMTTTAVMCAAVLFVLTFSNMIVSALRKWIPPQIRIIAEITIIAALVIIADQFLKAFLFDISKQLSIFVGLIITNCIVLGRAEGFANSNPVVPSILDGASSALGYGWILMTVSFIRELLGSGTLFGFHVIPQAAYDAGYENMGIMVLAPGAFFVLGILIWIQRTLSERGGKKR